MRKKKLENEVFTFLSKFGGKIRTKFDNICGKTGQYNVPIELFQKRTSRTNRVIISWKTVQKNHLTLQHLESFEGGCVVEFINNDFFLEENKNIPLFNILIERLGSDELVSSIISIRSESKRSSSAEQREAFSKLIDNTCIKYRGKSIYITKSNYKDFKIKTLKDKFKYNKNKGNEKWEGFLFISIKGGQQDNIESHSGEELLLFNPACEYANDKVCRHINYVMSYFALMSISRDDLLSIDGDSVHSLLVENLKNELKQIKYNYLGYEKDLLEYCSEHPSLKMNKGYLFDPIQVKKININDFNIDEKDNPDCLDFTHDEAVNFERYYWDEINKCLLTPARPTNIFWSKHLSNMMQQNFTLKEYFANEESIVKRRKELLGA